MQKILCCSALALLASSGFAMADASAQADRAVKTADFQTSPPRDATATADAFQMAGDREPEQLHASELSWLLAQLVVTGIVVAVAFYVRKQRESSRSGKSSKRSRGRKRSRSGNRSTGRRSGGGRGGGTRGRGGRRGIRCPQCRKRYDPGIETDDLDSMPAELSFKVVCPACGQWLRLPENEPIPDPAYPAELTRQMKDQATLLD